MREVAHFGPKRGGVRVMARKGAVLVLWPPRKQRTFPNTPEGRLEAVEFAKGVHAGPPKVTPEALTVRELWLAYATAEFPALRPRAQQLMAQRWAKFEAYKGHGFLAVDVTLEHMDEYRAALEKLRPKPDQPKAPNQVKLLLQTVKIVYRWARSRKLVISDVPDYQVKMAKEQRPAEPDEYLREDFEALVAEFDPRKANQWRPWAALMLIGHQGVRVNAALHLGIEDFAGGRLWWRSEWDKVGREWSQPLRDGALSALLTCLWWREKDGYTGRWLFYSSHTSKQEADRPYGVQALWRALRLAEDRARVPHRPLRALHGLRRMVAGDVLELTGDPKAAMDFIGDRDMGLIQKYLKRREERGTEVARRMDDSAMTTANLSAPPAVTEVVP